MCVIWGENHRQNFSLWFKTQSCQWPLNGRILSPAKFILFSCHAKFLSWWISLKKQLYPSFSPTQTIRTPTWMYTVLRLQKLYHTLSSQDSLLCNVKHPFDLITVGNEPKYLVSWASPHAHHFCHLHLTLWVAAWFRNIRKLLKTVVSEHTGKYGAKV